MLRCKFHFRVEQLVVMQLRVLTADQTLVVTAWLLPNSVEDVYRWALAVCVREGREEKCSGDHTAAVVAGGRHRHKLSPIIMQQQQRISA